jgi:hypothetical protein
MEAWWQSLTMLNKAFAIASLVFSVLFLWQAIAAILGFDTDSHADFGHADVGHPDMSGAEHDVHQSDHHAVSGAAFSLVSLRSVIAFCTLFSWAGNLYLATGTSIPLALLFSFLWGMAAMVSVSYLLHWLLRMQEIGDSSVASALGEEGTVYIAIPSGGTGKIRVLVRGIVSFVHAQGREGGAIPVGAKVRVVSMVNPNTVEVQHIHDSKGE